MPVYALPETPWFPPSAHAEPDGLAAIGGHLTPDWLTLAYSRGFFPWFQDPDPILWWTPDPRYLLFPPEVKVSSSMRQVFRKNLFTVTADHAFETVMRQCGLTPRPGQVGTWVSEEMVEAYVTLHQQGKAHSIEVWQEDELVGGLYGVTLGRAFFGESMFSLRSNASKTGLIALCRHLTAEHFPFVDCQVGTEHLESMGARPVKRTFFEEKLQIAICEKSTPNSWKDWFPAGNQLLSP